MSSLDGRLPEFFYRSPAAIGKDKWFFRPHIFAHRNLEFKVGFFESPEFQIFPGWEWGYRLVLAPALVWMIYRIFNFEDELILHVTILESGMAPHDHRFV